MGYQNIRNSIPQSMMTNAIDAFQLTKYYPQHESLGDVILDRHQPVPAVDQVSLTVPAQEVFGLLGPNGAGKTTLVKMLCTLITPTSGEARVCGHDLRAEQAVKASLGLVTSDERSFYWRLSGRANLRFYAALHGLAPESVPPRITEVLDIVGLRTKADQPFRTYSTGMRQRLSIARALLHHPQILFLDEPTKGLDPTATRQLHTLIREDLIQRQEMTVFLTTHRLEEAEALCDRVGILHEGRILAAGPLEELREKYQKDSLQDIFPAVLRQPQTPPPPVSFPEIGNSREPETASIRPQPGPFRKMMAFLRRDFRSEFSYRLSFFLQFFHVFFSVAVFYFIAQMIGEADIPQLEPYGGDYFPFVLLGIALSGYVGVGLSSFSRGIRKAQTTGTLEAMLSTPTRLSTIVISSSLWSYLLTTFRVLVYLILGALFLGAEFTLQGWGWAGLILLLTIVSLSSLGIVAASFIMVLKKGDPVTWAFGALTNLLGGIYYPVEILPRWLQFFSALLPVTYSLRGMRRALLQGGGFPVLKMDLAALVGFSVVLLPLSLAAFRYAVRRAKRDGSLTHY